MWRDEAMKELPGVWDKLKAQLDANLEDFHRLLPDDAPRVTVVPDEERWIATLNRLSVEVWVTSEKPEILWKAGSRTGALLLYGTSGTGFFLAANDGTEVLKGPADAAEKILVDFLHEAYHSDDDTPAP